MPKLSIPKFDPDNTQFEVLEEATGLKSGDITYTMQLLKLTFREQDSSDHAEMICFAYKREGIERGRPISVCFNGGPGSSSSWLHMGAVGPYRIKTDENGKPVETKGHYSLEENQHTLLGKSDLLLIDPMGTGFSRSYPKDNSKEFWGVQSDVASIALFIDRYLNHEGRFADPVFLLGESYGTTRAVTLAEHLQEQYNLFVKGITLVSMVLDFPTIVNESVQGSGDQVFLNLIPTMAMAAHFHKKIAKEFQDLSHEELLSEVQEFIRNDLLPLFYDGNAISTKDFRRMAKKLSDFTGMSAEKIMAHNARVSLEQFIRELLEDFTIGAYDSRLKGPSLPDGADSRAELYEPSSVELSKALTPIFKDYLRQHFPRSTLSLPPYITLNYDVFASWFFGPWDTEKSFDASPSLEHALQADPDLLVHIACGLYDLVTPVQAAHQTVQHLAIGFKHPEVIERIGFGHYPGGHMLYTVKDAHQTLMADIVNMMEHRLELMLAATSAQARVESNRYASFKAVQAHDDAKVSADFSGVEVSDDSEELVDSLANVF